MRPSCTLRVSRLVIDLNRDPSAPDSIVTQSETTRIPGNASPPRPRRPAARRPSTSPITALSPTSCVAASRRAVPTSLVALHSFNPVYRGIARPWPVGILFDGDRRLADPLIAELRGGEGLLVGENEPYGPWDRVYHTLERHGRSRGGLPVVMIELRNDEIGDPAGQQIWADRLAASLGHLAALAGVRRQERGRPARTGGAP